MTIEKTQVNIKLQGILSRIWQYFINHFTPDGCIHCPVFIFPFFSDFCNFLIFLYNKALLWEFKCWSLLFSAFSDWNYYIEIKKKLIYLCILRRPEFVVVRFSHSKSVQNIGQFKIFIFISRSLQNCAKL